MLLHELGHAVVAMRNGIGILGIDLWMFGGVAKMERDTRLAGRRVPGGGGGAARDAADRRWSASARAAADHRRRRRPRTRIAFDATGGDEVLAVLGYLAFDQRCCCWSFNLIPGFPLDGGRIARAIAWWRTGDREQGHPLRRPAGPRLLVPDDRRGRLPLSSRATVLSGIWLGFVGLFLGQAARQAEVQTAITSRIEGLRVSDVMDAEPVAIPDDLTLDRALDEFFLRYGYPWFPVVDADRPPVGAGHAGGAWRRCPRPRGPAAPSASVMARRLRRRAAACGSGSRSRSRRCWGSRGCARSGRSWPWTRRGGCAGIVTVDQVRRALRPCVTRSDASSAAEHHAPQRRLASALPALA